MLFFVVMRASFLVFSFSAVITKSKFNIMELMLSKPIKK
ncbi:hypothetical protein Hsw_0066 [Hymenobacter swuensis DY53]|uniref:Uncharacterized protein n=1 Tax=Hymenobacter swuensis DY53 TaxID=1227739 RepID=W8EZ76_9BACT|nr:hypothetical protein Hsw_0066 [Hymenobacter swuensis DY53]